MKIQIVQLNPIVGDLKGNTQKIIQSIRDAKGYFDLLLFSELVLTGYPAQDFLLQEHFIHEVEAAAQEIICHTQGIAIVFGLPRRSLNGKLHISAALIVDGQRQDYYDKCCLLIYDVFNERRYFEPGESVKIFDLYGKKIALTICEDIWSLTGEYLLNPIDLLKKENIDYLLNLSASPYSLDKWEKRLQVCRHAAQTLNCPVILCNQVGGNDSLIFDGRSLHVNAKGELVQVAAAFQEDRLAIQAGAPIVFQIDQCRDLFDALVLGLRDYMHKSGFKQACIGLSGGIDSALTAVIAAHALGKENIVGIAMPSRFSSDESLKDAVDLAVHLGIELKNISIEKPFQAYLDLLEPLFQNKPFDVTEENLQARIRGMILMAMSNKFNYIVLSTGNKSEMAMGYTTLYGDLCGGIAVIGDVTKKQVYELADWVNRDKEVIPWSSIHKAPSAELRFNQCDSDTLPDYVIVDLVVHGYVVEHLSAQEMSQKYHIEITIVENLIQKMHSAEYKRRQAPPALRISEKAFSVGRHFPIVQKFVQ